MERVAIFIDGSNFYHSMKERFFIHDNVDFRAAGFDILVKSLTRGRSLVAVCYYNAPLDRNYNPGIYSKQQGFFSELKRLPKWIVTLCQMRKEGIGKYTVKGDDIHIAVDMVSLAYEDLFDTAILVSGDGDFVPAIKKIQQLGKQVENAYFSVSFSSYLKQTCNSSFLLDNLIDKILKN